MGCSNSSGTYVINIEFLKYYFYYEIKITKYKNKELLKYN